MRRDLIDSPTHQKKIKALINISPVKKHARVASFNNSECRQQASNQSDLDLSDEKAIQIQADCSQQVTPNKNSSNFIEKFVKADLEFVTILAQATNQQSDLDLRSD